MATQTAAERRHARAVAHREFVRTCPTQRLLDRIGDKWVTRVVTPAVPVRVEYRLTPLGESLLPVVHAIKGWAEAHIEEIDNARADYDRAAV